METVETLIELGPWLALFGAVVAPPVISLVKNVGGAWPGWAKQLVALLFAVAGAFAALGASGLWELVDVSSFEMFWMPFLLAVFTEAAAQYASYRYMWSANESRPLGLVERPLANAGAPAELKLAA